MGKKERCVCEICSCGKHHCGPSHKFKSIGKLDLKNQGDIYVASKASYEFPDTLNLFEGGHDHITVAKGDYRGHLKADLSRPRPADQIGISSDKMAGDTTLKTHYPAYDLSGLTVTAGEVKKTMASLDKVSVKLDATTSYADHYPKKDAKFERSFPAVHLDELKGPSGELDLSTVNKSDYVAFKYGRPHLNKISDSNVLGVSDNDRLSKSTTIREHYPGFKSEPSKQIKAKEEGFELGTDGRSKTSVYGEDFRKVQPKVRKSKRRGTAVDFGVEFDHSTSYKTQFESKSTSISKISAAKFSDELSLFTGQQDHNTIAQSDYRGHDKMSVVKHRPEDQIKIPSDKMSSETVTLGHFPAHALSADLTVKTAGKTALSSTQAFDLNSAMANIKMSSDTSYKQQYDKKALEEARVNKFSFKDEIPASTGQIDLATMHKSDYLKHSYGRPQVHRIKDNNVFGINYSLGKSAPTVESLPPSPQLKVDVADVATFKSAPVKDKNTSYSNHFIAASGKTRTSKRKGSTVDFGRRFYGDTSYGAHFKTKTCLVPTLDKLDEYTFKEIQTGHKIYTIDCACPPKGACGCTPPPTAAVKA